MLSDAKPIITSKKCAICDGFSVPTALHFLQCTCSSVILSRADAVAFRFSLYPVIDTASIFLDEVACSGDENRLVECPRSSSVFCRFFHMNDAGARCQGM